MAAGPLGKVAKVMSSILESSEAMYAVIGMLAAIKLVGLISGITSLGMSMTAFTGAAAFGIGALTLGAGLVIGGLAASYFLGSMKKEQKSFKRYNTLGATEMVSLDQGSAIFDAGESVVRTENFSKLTDEQKEGNRLTKELVKLFKAAAQPIFPGATGY